MSSLSIEEQRLMKSLERINDKLKGKLPSLSHKELPLTNLCHESLMMLILKPGKIVWSSRLSKYLGKILVFEPFSLSAGLHLLK